MAEQPSLSVNEWVVLALLAEQSAHGFALARELETGTDLGRVLTVHRPLVYRALGRLVDAGLAEAYQPEPGDGGPSRRTHRATPHGQAAVGTWLERPVVHIRDLRIEFLVKMRLRERSGRQTSRLVKDQRRQLANTLDELQHGDGDVVDQWRHHNAVAVRQFLDSLA
jgi:DNA-binding PadR family transcriptional regulator